MGHTLIGVAFDLIIIGAGIVGAACAHAATKADLRVALVEFGPIGGDATAAGMGHLVSLDDNPAEFALIRYSLSLWRELGCLAEAQFSACGTLWVAESSDEIALAAEKLARLKSAGIAAEFLDTQSLYDAEFELAPGLAGGVLVPSDAVVYAPCVARWLVKRACQYGAELFIGHKVIKLKNGGVLLDNGTSIVGSVLVTCGCNTPMLLPEMIIRPRKGHLVVTEQYPSFIRHQVVEMGYATSAHGNADNSVACNVQPRPNGQLLIGSSREFNKNDKIVSPVIVANMLMRAFHFLPKLRTLQGIRIWTGFRPATPDGLPYIGCVPDRRDIWIAAGHEGMGITTSLGTAELLIDSFLGRVSAIDPKPYVPARIMQ